MRFCADAKVNNLFIDLYSGYDIIRMNRYSCVHQSTRTIPFHKEETNMDNIDTVKENMPVEEEVFELAELFKMLSDPTRVKILYTILENEMSVGDITEIVGSTQSAVSHQLRVLKQARLVKYRKVGKSVIYSVSDEHVATILSMGMEHISE